MSDKMWLFVGVVIFLAVFIGLLWWVLRQRDEAWEEVADLEAVSRGNLNAKESAEAAAKTWEERCQDTERRLQEVTSRYAKYVNKLEDDLAAARAKEGKGNGFLETAVTVAERPVWEQTDAGSLRAWLGTGSGKKLAGILRFDEQKHNRSAVLRVSAHKYNCGWAAGYHAACQAITNLSADVRPQQDDDSGERDGAAAFAERNAP